MKSFRRTYAVITAIISAFFAILLFTAIVDYHGIAKSLLFVAMGVAVIWGIYYFFLGSVFQHFYEKGKKEGEEDESGFV
jgi:hypothetical protein